MALNIPRRRSSITLQELEEVGRAFFAKRKLGEDGDNFYIKLRSSRVSKEAVKAALRFEFDLPYRAGKTLDIAHKPMCA